MVSGEKEEDLQPSQMGESVEGRDMARVGLQLGEGERGSAVLTSIVAFPLFWALETSLVGWVAGLRWALAFFLSLPLGGLIAYRYLVGTGRLRHQLRFGALLLTRAQEARRLLAERREIVEELERAKRDYLGRRERIERLK